MNVNAAVSVVGGEATSTADSRPRSLVVLPLVAPVFWMLVSVTAEVWGSAMRLFSNDANPWEYGIVFEAWRVSHGTNPYAAAALQATQMYGALTTYVYAPIVRWFGPGLVAPRLLSTILAVATVTLILRVIARRAPRRWQAIGALLLLNVFTFTHHLVEVRPSMLSLSVAMLALIMICHATARESVMLGLAGALLSVVGFLLKQTAAMVAVIPAVWLLTYGRWSGQWTRTRAVVAALPIGALALAIAAMKAIAPTIFFYMMVVPTKYRIVPTAVVLNLEMLLKEIPLFALVFLDWQGRREERRDDLGSWLVVAFVVTAGAGMLAGSKSGGEANSFMYCLLISNAFIVWHGPRALRGLLAGVPNRRPFQLALGLALATLVGASTMHGVPRFPKLASATRDRRAREAIVNVVRDLPGRVTCPEDPLIPVLAGRPGNVDAAFELDIQGVEWAGYVPTPLLPVIRNDLASAAHTVTIEDGFFATNFPLWYGTLLREMSKLGFVKTDVIGRYALWSRPTDSSAR